MARTQANGYGYRHQQLRRKWAPAVGRGEVACARCGKLIEPGQAWDLGHVDEDRSSYQGPEHARCNRATAARAKARRVRRRLQAIASAGKSRVW